jgi:hypothetical protein
MDELSPKSRELLERARLARPSPAERSRLRRGVDSRLVAAGLLAAGTATATVAEGGGAAAAAAGAAGGAGAKVTLFGALVKIGLAGLCVGAIGFGGSAFFQGAPPRTLEPGMQRVNVSAALARARPSADLTLAPPPKSSPESSLASSAVPRPSNKLPAASAEPVSIAGEVAMLRRAQKALKQGDAEASLAAIDALAAKHPKGALREERLAARVLALCAAGRTSEARAAGQAFLAEAPNSVQASRVRASCAFTKK